MVEEVLKQNDDVNVTSTEGFSMLETAVTLGCTDIVRLLIDGGAPVNKVTYSCLYFSVVKFSSVLTTPAYNTSYTTLYTRSAFPDDLVCQFAQAVGSDLYILAGGSVNASVVFKGSVDGSAPLTPVFNIYDEFPVSIQHSAHNSQHST